MAPLEIDAQFSPSIPPLESPGLPEEPEPVRGEDASSSTFWRLVNLEVGEAILLLFFNAGLALLSAWMSGMHASRLYGELWMFLVPVHACLSWTLLMVPLVLAGQSPLMGPLAISLDAPQPERRMSYSLFHLLSVVCFPASFLCMVLTPAHRTLAELLTGQELIVQVRCRFR